MKIINKMIIIMRINLNFYLQPAPPIGYLLLCSSLAFRNSKWANQLFSSPR